MQELQVQKQYWWRFAGSIFVTVIMDLLPYGHSLIQTTDTFPCPQWQTLIHCQPKIWTAKWSTHLLIFAWFYWLLHVTLRKSPDSYHATTPACVDICPPIVSVEDNIVSTIVSTSLFSFLHGRLNQTRVMESSDSDKKASGKCCSGKYIKVNKICCKCLQRWRKSRVGF